MAAVLAVTCCVACRPDSRSTPPTNVLLISLDTVRQDFLGCAGHRPRHAPEISPTPTLDRLAQDGVRMVDAYAPSSWTLPSHLSLFTGATPLVHGVETEVGALDPALPTLTEILSRNGYRTFGVYSAPYLEPHWGFARGFDEYDAEYGADVVAASARAAANRAEVEQAVAASDWRRYDELKVRQTEIEATLNKASETAVSSEPVTATVVSALERLAHQDRPWFVFAHFFDAHCDYVPPPPYDTRFDPDYRGPITGTGCLAGPEVASPDPDRLGGLIRRIGDRDLEHVRALYEGEIAWVDAHVGTILGVLDGLGLRDRTLVIVTSDHGEEFFEHGTLGHRHTLYEESVRIPLLLRLPGVLPAGAAVRGAVSLSDVLPTVLDVLGLPPASPAGSATFLPLIRSAERPADRRALARLVMMYAGDVGLDTGEHVQFRQIAVSDSFRSGPIKITRSRAWPQFPSDLSPETATILRQEAGKQYAQETLRWIDLDRFPQERDDQYSSRFEDAAVRAALQEFRSRYAELAPLRRHHASAVPTNLRRNLESLGYVDASAMPMFPEPDVVLPPPATR